MRSLGPDVSVQMSPELLVWSPSRDSLLVGFRQTGSASSHALSSAWRPPWLRLRAGGPLLSARLDLKRKKQRKKRRMTTKSEPRWVEVGLDRGRGRPLCRPRRSLYRLHSAAGFRLDERRPGALSHPLPHPLSTPPSLSLLPCLASCCSRIMSHMAQTPLTQHDLFSYQLLTPRAFSQSAGARAPAAHTHTHTCRQARFVGVHLQLVGETPP